MALLESILAWILQTILAFMMKKAIGSVQDISEQNKKDEELGKINEENIKKYEEAKSRVERISAAVSLLNRNP